MNELSKYTISSKSTLFEALNKLNNLSYSLTVFVIDDEKRLTGSVTDGDIRRGILIRIASISKRAILI